MRLLALDLDDTLAAPNRRVGDAVRALLKQVSARECQVMLLSGKPAAYLAGFARQLGVGSPVIAGENGAVIMSSPDFPPQWERVARVTPESRAWLEDIAASMCREFGDSVWLQPNRVNVSVFWRTAEVRDSVIAAVEAHMAGRNAPIGARSFVHGDCAEIVVPGADKGTALAYVLQRVEVDAADAVAIGDSANDLPMFEVAGLSIGIGVARHGCDLEFADIERALSWLLEEKR
jgi:HAD superfamily hydrolase (TIGR01484 family)